jgi:hypothetical protein
MYGFRIGQKLTFKFHKKSVDSSGRDWDNKISFDKIKEKIGPDITARNYIKHLYKINLEWSLNFNN